MDDKEIMKQFEESFSEQEKSDPVVPYKATRNMNTEISNPSMNLNNNMNVNIKQEKIDNTMTATKIEQPSIINPVEQPIIQPVPIQQQPVQNTQAMNMNMQPIMNNQQPSGNVNPSQSVVKPSINPALQSLPAEKNLNNNVANQEVKLDITERGMTSPQPMNDTVNTTTTYVYNQTVDSNKKKETSIKVSGETKLMLALVLIIFIFILVMPTIYDFFRQIKLGM